MSSNKAPKRQKAKAENPPAKSPQKTVGGGEDRQLVDIMAGIADALADVVNSHTELVVHDLLRPENSINNIVNGDVSGRKEGQSILTVLSNDKGFETFVSSEVPATPYGITTIKDYQTGTRDGRRLYSTSVIVNDADGKPATAFCINVDRDKLRKTFRQFEESMLPLTSSETAPDEVSRNGHDDSELTMEELINEIIDTSLSEYSSSPKRMTKDEKMSAVVKMKTRGLFLIRGSVELVAKRLGTTRHTIYNYLEQAES
ncbi:helix-turn-helix transcriptional regulator [Hyphococcus luteus]|uniref:helix-turn-helix transcriptional regulator n=1 Tax=Hyphococcus luteus TaxID=2058213 RepID=UPI0013FE4E0A|nr:PAS domain-containing protein [Marinicaulis flavus]